MLQENIISRPYACSPVKELTFWFGKAEKAERLSSRTTEPGLIDPSMPEGGLRKPLNEMLVQPLTERLTWREEKLGRFSDILVPLDAEEMCFE